MSARLHSATGIEGGADNRFRLVRLYRTGTNCPGCHGTNWHVGRQMAECARCGTALPIGPNQ